MVNVDDFKISKRSTFEKLCYDCSNLLWINSTAGKYYKLGEINLLQSLYACKCFDSEETKMLIKILKEQEPKLKEFDDLLDSIIDT